MKYASLVAVVLAGPALGLSTAASGMAVESPAAPDAKAGSTELLYIDQDRALRAIGGDGTGDRAVGALTDVYRAQWSPDGKAVVVEGNRDGVNALYVMSAAGTGVRRLTFGPASALGPDWSPDGKQIAFIRCGTGGQCNLVTIPASGGAPRVVSRPGQISDPYCYGPDYERAVAWRPDGRALAVGVWCDDDSGGDYTAIVSAATGAQIGHVYGDDVSWSPNGKQIINHAWSTTYDGEPPVVQLRSAAGSLIRRVSPPSTDAIGWEQPVWSPDGRTVAYARSAQDYGARSAIVISGLDGTRPRVLMRGAGYPDSPPTPQDWRTRP